MKKILVSLIMLTLIGLSSVYAQVPQKMSYQAVVRNNNGVLVQNTGVGVRISILADSISGTVVYQETYSPNPQTNTNGLVTLEIGSGTPSVGTFAGINWADTLFVKIETDVAGGTNYNISGVSQLLSVPYALYAKTAQNSYTGNISSLSIGNMLYWNGSQWTLVSPGTNGQPLTYCNGVPTWGSCTPVLSTLTTTAISSITTTTAISGGNITNDGGASITARGICWSTTSNPTITGSHTTDGSGTGSFTSNITGLSSGTTYYVRAYATNSAGTAYGNQVSFTTTSTSFTCGTSIITDFDVNTYNTVQIGTQCWMKQNLKATHYSNGTAMVDGTNAGNTTGNYTTKYYFDYNNTPANTITYGKLYTYAAMMNGSASSSANPSGVQGVCPTGWHVPSNAEWTTLETYLGGNSIAGGKLKETGTSHWQSPNTGASNTSDFTALPGGGRYGGGAFGNVGDDGNWWSSTEYNTSTAWSRVLRYYGSNIYSLGFNKDLGFSVRCVKD